MKSRNVKICSACFEECTPRVTDVGIGRYEYGSQVSTHNDYIVESDCCQEDVLLVDKEHVATTQTFAAHYKEIPSEVKDELGITTMTLNQYEEEYDD